MNAYCWLRDGGNGGGTNAGCSTPFPGGGTRDERSSPSCSTAFGGGTRDETRTGSAAQHAPTGSLPHDALGEGITGTERCGANCTATDEGV